MYMYACTCMCEIDIECCHRLLSTFVVVVVVVVVVQQGLSLNLELNNWLHCLAIELLELSGFLLPVRTQTHLLMLAQQALY